MEVVGSDEIGTGVKASKAGALTTSGGACELTESTQLLVRSVATFEIGRLTPVDRYLLANLR